MERSVGILATVVATAVLLVACSGGDNATTTASPATSAAGSTTASTAPTTNDAVAQAGPELSAFHLLDTAAFSAALGEPVAAIEDDGVVPDAYFCELSQARAVSTSGAKLTLLLVTSKDGGTAQNAYQTYSSAAFGNGVTPTPVDGSGDKAGYAAGTAVVLKGSQVLQIRSQPNSAAQANLDLIKANGGDPTSAYNVILETAQKLAPAAARGMNGDSCSGTPSIDIPAGAMDPCLAKPADVAAALGIDSVTATNVISDEPPSLECQYGLGADGIFTIYTATDQQLLASVEPIAAADSFAQDEADATSAFRATEQVETFVAGRLKGFGATNSKAGINEELLISGDVTSTRDLSAMRQLVSYHGDQPEPTAGAIGNILLRFLENASAGLIKPEDCEKFMHVVISESLYLDPAVYIRDFPPGSDPYNAESKLTEYCLSAASTHGG